MKINIISHHIKNIIKIIMIMIMMMTMMMTIVMKIMKIMKNSISRKKKMTHQYYYSMLALNHYQFTIHMLEMIKKML